MDIESCPVELYSLTASAKELYAESMLARFSIWDFMFVSSCSAVFAASSNSLVAIAASPIASAHSGNRSFAISSATFLKASPTSVDLIMLSMISANSSLVVGASPLNSANASLNLAVAYSAALASSSILVSSSATAL